MKKESILKKPVFWITILVVIGAIVAICFFVNPTKEDKAEIPATETIADKNMNESEVTKKDDSEAKDKNTETQNTEAQDTNTQNTDSNQSGDASKEESSATAEDYYKVATSLSASEVEKFAMDVQKDVLGKDWTALSEKIAYPITINGNTINDSAAFLKLDFNNISQEFMNEMKAESCHEMFCNYQGIMMGATGEIWLSGVIENDKETFKVIAINGMF